MGKGGEGKGKEKEGRGRRGKRKGKGVGGQTPPNKNSGLYGFGRGLLFPGEFVTSENVATLVLYNSSPEGATICIAPKEGVNATAL